MSPLMGTNVWTMCLYFIGENAKCGNKEENIANFAQFYLRIG